MSEFLARPLETFLPSNINKICDWKQLQLKTPNKTKKTLCLYKFFLPFWQVYWWQSLQFTSFHSFGIRSGQSWLYVCLFHAFRYLRAARTTPHTLHLTLPFSLRRCQYLNTLEYKLTLFPYKWIKLTVDDSNSSVTLQCKSYSFLVWHRQRWSISCLNIP